MSKKVSGLEPQSHHNPGINPGEMSATYLRFTALASLTLLLQIPSRICVLYGSATASGVPPVARMLPASTSEKPITMPTVSRSFRSVTPSTAATAGFT